MELGNAKPKTATNPEQIDEQIRQARSCLNNSKDAAMEAAAHAYMIWLMTQKGDAKKWLETSIKTRNDEIEAHNTLEKNDTKRAKDFVDGKLSKEDRLNQDPKDKDAKAEIETEKENLRKIHARTKKETADRQLVPIEAREDANKFIKLVKFVFAFDRQSDSDVTTRYATVLSWIEANVAKGSPSEAAEIVSAMREAGGFEYVLRLQRDLTSLASEEAEDRKIVGEYLRDQAKKVFKEAAPKASFEMEAKHAKDGVVLLIGRYTGGKVEIISEAELGDNDIERAITRFGDESDKPANPNCEFVSRALDLGEMIKEGQTTALTYSDGGSGDKIKVQRVITLRPGPTDGKSQLVISARHTEASPVIYATPKANSLGSTKQPLMLANEARKRIEREFDDAAKRRLLELSAIENPKGKNDKEIASPLAWIATNRALADKNRDSALKQYYWNDLANASSRPLDVDNFQPQFTQTIDIFDIRTIFEERLKAWGESKSSSKNQTDMRLVFDKDILKLVIHDEPDLDIKLKQAITGKFSMRFKPRDVFDLISHMKDQHAEHYVIMGDEAGLMRIKWDDDLGEYEVNLPTLGTDGRLQSRRVSPMRMNAAPIAESPSQSAA